MVTGCSVPGGETVGHQADYWLTLAPRLRISGAVPPLLYMTMTFTGTAHTLCTSSADQKKGNHDSEIPTSMVLMHHLCLNEEASVVLLYL